MPIYSLDDINPILPERGALLDRAGRPCDRPGAAGRDVTLWFGCVLRGDNELIDIGEGANIQEGALLHTDMGFPLSIGPSCTIGHHAILHGCASARTPYRDGGDGAQRREDRRELPRGRQRPGDRRQDFPGQLPDRRGARPGGPHPGRRRDLERLRRSARHYVENGRRYRSSLKRLD